MFVLYIEQNIVMSNSKKKGYSQLEFDNTFRFLCTQPELYATTPASYTCFKNFYQSSSRQNFTSPEHNVIHAMLRFFFFCKTFILQ